MCSMVAMGSTWQQFIEALRRGRRFIAHDVWRIGGPGEVAPHGIVIKQIRVMILLVRSVLRGPFLLRAAALSFTTTLSLVPLLALLFFVIQAFDLGRLGQDMAEMLARRVRITTSAERIAPVPAETEDVDKNAELQHKIVSIIIPEDMVADGDELNPVELLMKYAQRGADLRSLGVMGLLFIVTTAFGLMMTIESSFNAIWGVKNTRSWYRMFSDYLVIIILLPFLVAFVIGGNAFLQTRLDGSGWYSLMLQGAQYVVIWLAFATAYYVVPNTRVKIRYALLAGVVAGTLWSFTAWAFFRFQYGLANYSVVYSGFALFPMAMMWVYFSWVIVLLGAELTFAYQNEKTFALERLASEASFAYREALGIRIMIELARRFEAGQPGLTVRESAVAWNVPTLLINATLDQLEEAGLVMRGAGAPVTYHPARALTRIAVWEILAALRNSGRDPSPLRQEESLRTILETVDGAHTPELASTLADLAASVPGSGGANPAEA